MTRTYKVVVIDDMPDIVHNIRESIDWESMQCSVAGTAEDGSNGEQLILETRPDIVITDIRMPGYDGLEMSRRILPHLPHAKIICITGFQDFSYAQMACNLGLFSLVTKPIDLSDLTLIIRNAVQRIQQQENDSHASDSMERSNSDSPDQLQLRLPLMRKSIVVELLNRYPQEPQRLERQLKATDLSGRLFGIILFRFLYEAPSHRHTLISCIEQTADDMNSEYIPVSILRDRSLIVTIFLPAGLSVKDAARKLSSIRTTLQESSGLKRDHVLSSASSIGKDPAELFALYTEAEARVNRHLFLDSPLTPDEDQDNNPLTIDKGPDINKFSILRQNILDVPWDKLSPIIETYIENMGHYSGNNPEVARFLTAELCFTLRAKARPATGDFSAEDFPALDYLESIKTLGSISSFRSFLLKFCQTCRRYHTSHPVHSLIVRKAIAYIEEHALTNISLTALSEYLQVRPEYLSSLIKKETGQKYIELVTRMRMERAKKLLVDPRNRISDIAESVGYNDYIYFFQVFKKYEGISPSEYRKRHA